MPNQYAFYLTAAGQAALANAAANDTPIGLTTFAVGDGGGSEYVIDPAAMPTGLVNQVYTGTITDITVDPNNANRVITQCVIPATVGGFSICEIVLLDAANVPMAIGTMPMMNKIVLATGSTLDLNIKVNLDLANTSLVTLTVDPSTIFATKEYVDSLTGGGAGVGHIPMVLVYGGMTIADGTYDKFYILLNQCTIYLPTLASTPEGATFDFFSQVDGCLIYGNLSDGSGTLYLRSLVKNNDVTNQATSNYTINNGEQITIKRAIFPSISRPDCWVQHPIFAALMSPSFKGTPTAPTPSNGDNSTNIATTAFVMANGASGNSINYITVGFQDYNIPNGTKNATYIIVNTGLLRLIYLPLGSTIPDGSLITIVSQGSSGIRIYAASGTPAQEGGISVTGNASSVASDFAKYISPALGEVNVLQKFTAPWDAGCSVWLRVMKYNW